MADGANKSLRDQRDILASINGELGKRTNSIQAAVKELSKLESITRKLQDAQAGYTDLSEKQLLAEQGKAQSAVAELNRQARLVQQKAKIVKLDEASLKAAKNLSKEERALLSAKIEGFQIEKRTVTLLQEELDLRMAAEKSLGSSAGILKVLGKAGVTFGGALEKAKKASIENLRTLKQELQETENISDEEERIAARRNASARSTIKNLKIRSQLVGDIAKNTFETLTGTASITKLLIDGFFKFDEATTKFSNTTGTAIQETFIDMSDSSLNVVDAMSQMTTLSEVLRINVAASFSPEIIKKASELEQILGLSAESTAKLSLMFAASGQDIEKFTESAYDSAEALRQQGKNVVLPAKIIEDVSNVSGRLAVNLASNPGALRDAAVAAQRFGLTLQEIEQTSESLLDFESSISAEIEAQILTGVQFNGNRLRSLAFTRDMAGLTEEITSNQELLNAYTEGNVFQQKSIEKFLGMSAEQMKNMIFFSEMERSGNVAKAATLAGITEKEGERLTAQKEFNKALEEFQFALTPILNKFTDILKSSDNIKLILFSLAGLKLTSLVSQFAQMFYFAQGAAALQTMSAGGGGAYGAAQLTMMGGGSIAKTAAGGAGRGLLGRGLMGAAGAFGPVGLAIAGGALLGYGAYKMFSKDDKPEPNLAPGFRMEDMDDGVIGSDGRILVKGPKGSVRLNSSDTVIAGTNLGGGNKELIARIDRLIAVTQQGTTIEMDGNLVGKSIANSTSRLG